jgi:outer membrane protein
MYQQHKREPINKSHATSSANAVSTARHMRAFFFSCFLAFNCPLTLAEAPLLSLDKTFNTQFLTEAKALLNRGDAQAAYALLEPLENQYAGDPNFDYLFGFAAVESNHATRGAFALERVLANDPNNQDARAEMAKAHFMLGEIESSKTEFNHVLAQNPDAMTKRTVEKLLTAIQKLDGTTTTFGAYLELGLGYDSNVSSAPNLSTVSVPLFGGAVLDLGESGRELSDTVLNWAGGLSFRHPINPQWSAFGSVSLTGKNNRHVNAFDTQSFDLNAGIQYRLNQHSFTFALQDNHFDLDHQKFRNAYGATGQWQYNVDARNQAGLYTQYSRLKYPDNAFRDADRAVIGANVAHVFEGDWTPISYMSIYGGRENADNPQADFLDQTIAGMRFGGQLNMSRAWQVDALFSVEKRYYDEPDTVFLLEREDKQYDAIIGFSYIPARDWTVRPQLSYTKNSSNIDLNDYDRTIFYVNVRKDFRW